MILRPTRKAALLIESYFRSQKPFLHSRIFKLCSILVCLLYQSSTYTALSRQGRNSSRLKRTYRSWQGLGSAPSALRRNWGGSSWGGNRRDTSSSPGLDTLPQASVPDQWVAVAKQPRLGRSNPTGMSKILRWGFSGAGNLRTRERTFSNPTKSLLLLYQMNAGWSIVAWAAQCQFLKASESPWDSVNTKCQCGRTVRPCVTAEYCVSKLDEIQQSSRQKMFTLTHQTTCLKAVEIQPLAQQRNQIKCGKEMAVLVN